jgi:endonuclease YncB( thermonuclease family)
VRDGGRIEANGTVITLAGIAVRDADGQCKDAKGRAWACGARARAALMRLIRGRAVTCKVPASGKQKALTASCTVGGTDLSTWMVAQGWAEAKAPSEPKLAKAADAARKKKIGIWR